MSEMPSMILLKIPVRDVTTASTFYRDVVGLEQDFVAAEYGWAQFNASNLPIALYEPGKGGGVGTAGDCDSLHLGVADPDPVRQRLRDNGINPGDVEQAGNDGTVYLELQDPDGNTIKIFLQSTL